MTLPEIRLIYEDLFWKESLQLIVSGKLKDVKGEIHGSFYRKKVNFIQPRATINKIMWRDTENDLVTVESQDDLDIALKEMDISLKENTDKLLKIHILHSWR